MNLSPSQIQEISSTPLTNVGQMGYYNGNKYMYVKAGAAAVTRGKLVQSAAIVANHVDLAPAAAVSAGSKEVTVTLGATAATADQYKGGRMVVQDGAGEGRAYFIEGNLAADASGVCKLYLREAVDVALTVAASKINLHPQLANGVIASTAQTGRAVGFVQATSLTAAYYGWVLTDGPVAALFDEAVTAGSAVTIGTGVAGAVEAVDAVTEQIVGVVGPTDGVDTEYQLVYANISGGFSA